MTFDPIVESLRAELLARSARGQAEYGCTLARTDLSRLDWLRHARDEALDLACYAERAAVDESDPAEQAMLLLIRDLALALAQALERLIREETGKADHAETHANA